MKAALEAWGADSNLFHQGVARESNDKAVVGAAMSKPSVILRRPVGSHGPFREDADLPTSLSGVEPGHQPRKRGSKPKRQPAPPTDDKAARKAAQAFETAEKQRERERRKEEAVLEKQGDRPRQAIAEAEAILREAETEHDEKASAIEAERDALDKKLQAEDARWEKKREKLQTALQRVRDKE